MNKKNKEYYFILVVILFVVYVFFDLFLFDHNSENKFSNLLSFNSATVINATSTVNIATSTASSTRGLPPESPTNYTEQKDGTIIDNYTGLVWKKCVQGMSGSDCKSGSPSLREWAKANSECDNLSFAGKSDWRMPTKKELESIVDTSTRDVSINPKFFPRTTEDPYWTATSPADHLAMKFTVLFSDGSVYYNSTGATAATRCVRGGINL